MKIDIARLSEKELIELNHQIVERLKYLESMRTHEQMMEFNVGEKVSFEPPGREKRTGILVRYNRKTVSIVTETGERWNVPPQLLVKVKGMKPAKRSEEKVVKLKNYNHKKLIK